MQPMPVILAEGLTKRFHRPQGSLRRRGPVVTAVDGVDLTLPPGALLGILGPNGSGKTTLLKLLATLLLPTSGRLRVCGHDPERESIAVRARVGFVAGDERSFYWRLTGRQNLAFFASLHGLERMRLRRRIEELAAVLALGDLLEAPVDTYSSGMRQRLAVARGLLHDPALLLLDEPTRSLDPEAAESLRRLIAHLAREGGHTVVLVTHAPAEASALCTHLGTMHSGRLQIEQVS
jgi:ABC-2 type transport system ATP-binding protein